MFTAEPLRAKGISFSTNLSAHLQKTLSTITDKYFLWSDGTTALRLAYNKLESWVKIIAFQGFNITLKIENHTKITQININTQNQQYITENSKKIQSIFSKIKISYQLTQTSEGKP